MRLALASTERLTRRVRCDPWRGVPTGWRGPRGCACEGGSRASWPGDGCSAGTYACSFFFSGCRNLRAAQRVRCSGGKLGARKGWGQPIKTTASGTRGQPGEVRSRNGANGRVSRIPRDTLWIDTRGPSNPSSGICSEGRVSLACETSYPQPRTRNPGRRTQSAHSRWITLNTSPRAARSIDRGIDERHTTAPRDCGER